MGSDVRHVRGEAQKELVKKFEVFTSKGRSRWQVWSDWITISAIAVSNATDKSHFDEREQQYMTIVKKVHEAGSGHIRGYAFDSGYGVGGQLGTGFPWRAVYVLGAWK